ncbi:globin family protein [Niveibacterium sp. SC-1]|uniref:globin family protein n=1 Tax=Niveibacterium sp. SC-1 TaxID=3135646 RepID=UPI00311DFDD2
MTPQQIQRVQHSLELIAPQADLVATRFYDHLLTRHPALRPLFRHTDIRLQGLALMRMIVWAVQRLDNTAELLPALRELGARHVRYGVRAEHYAWVGASLLDTLAWSLGPDFTPELHDAWAAVYGVVAQTMQETTPEREPELRAA